MSCKSVYDTVNFTYLYEIGATLSHQFELPQKNGTHIPLKVNLPRLGQVPSSNRGSAHKRSLFFFSCSYYIREKKIRKAEKITGRLEVEAQIGYTYAR